MVNNTSRIGIMNELHVKSHSPVPIEKPFSKTHAPDFVLMLDETFSFLCFPLSQPLWMGQ